MDHSLGAVSETNLVSQTYSGRPDNFILRTNERPGLSGSLWDLLVNHKVGDLHCARLHAQRTETLAGSPTSYSERQFDGIQIQPGAIGFGVLHRLNRDRFRVGDHSGREFPPMSEGETSWRRQDMLTP
jgi:hypothetical protein